MRRKAYPVADFLAEWASSLLGAHDGAGGLRAAWFICAHCRMELASNGQLLGSWRKSSIGSELHTWWTGGTVGFQSFYSEQQQPCIFLANAQERPTQMEIVFAVTVFAQ